MSLCARTLSTCCRRRQRSQLSSGFHTSLISSSSVVETRLAKPNQTFAPVVTPLLHLHSHTHPHSLQPHRALHVCTPDFDVKDFIPKWIRRDREEEQQLDPADLFAHQEIAAKPAGSQPRVTIQKQYFPPPDLEAQVFEICRDVLDIDDQENFCKASLSDDDSKFQFLDACIEAFGKRIPSAFLDDIETVGDAVDFFAVEIRDKSKTLNELKQLPDAPRNLHVIPDYMTYEEEMEMYGGRDVFPHQDIIFDNLHDRGKYKSVRKPKCPWEEAEGFNLPPKYKKHQGY